MCRFSYGDFSVFKNQMIQKNFLQLITEINVGPKPISFWKNINPPVEMHIVHIDFT